MTELEKLKEQRRELNQRIKELEYDDKNLTIGRAKLGYTHYPTAAADHWDIQVRVDSVNKMQRKLWRCIIQGATKKEAVEQIPEVVADLQKLYERLSNGTD